MEDENPALVYSTGSLLAYSSFGLVSLSDHLDPLASFSFGRDNNKRRI